MITIEKKSLGVGRYINTKQVDTAIRNYKQERWAQNSKHIGKEDTMSSWYSIEELEQFIEKAKLHGSNGIRLYFGAYAENYEETPVFAGRQTVVMVATKAKRTENGVATKDIYVAGETGHTILAYGDGALCPPMFCPTEKGGGTGGGGFDSDNWGGIGTTLVDRGADGMVVV